MQVTDVRERGVVGPWNGGTEGQRDEKKKEEEEEEEERKKEGREKQEGK